MPTCYVAAPFGVKTSRDTDQVVDYDHVYQSAIRPAAEFAGCTVMRADEDLSGGIFHKSILRMGIAADVFIADLGDGNANVMYEVGVRHASRRGIAILIVPAGNRIPFNINYSRVLQYQVDSNGRLEDVEVARLRNLLTSVIELALGEHRNDSPVFEFFPGYHVELPEELQPREAKSPMYSPSLKQVFSRPESPAKRRESAKTAEEIVKTTAPGDPTVAVEVLKKYRDLGAWDDLIRFGDELPPPVRELAQVQKMLALALNRRNQSGDRERAVAMMERLVARKGDDGETHGILGRIYKDRFELSHDPADIQKAIAHYRAGFEKDPSDYYTGANLVNLLMVYGGDAGRPELTDVLPRVRRALETRMDLERPDNWDLATAVELAVSAGDWEKAREYARRIVASTPDSWVVEPMLASLRRLEQVLSREGIEALRGVEEILHGILDGPEARNA
jgi:tetratricopeptide (TPR) repeat protein